MKWQTKLSVLSTPAVYLAGQLAVQWARYTGIKAQELIWQVHVQVLFSATHNCKIMLQMAATWRAVVFFFF